MSFQQEFDLAVERKHCGKWRELAMAMLADEGRMDAVHDCYNLVNYINEIVGA